MSKGQTMQKLIGFKFSPKCYWKPLQSSGRPRISSDFKFLKFWCLQNCRRGIGGEGRGRGSTRIGGRGTGRGPLLWSQFKIIVAQSREVNSTVVCFWLFEQPCSLLVFSLLGDCCFLCQPCSKMLKERLCSLWRKWKQSKYTNEWDLSCKFSLFSFVFSFHTFVVTSITSFPLTGEHCLFNLDSLPCLWQR